MATSKRIIAIVGLGYVGLPLAVAFARHAEVIAFDISTRRVDELKKNVDITRETTSEELKSVNLTFTHEPALLANAKFIVVTVPTPIGTSNRPNLDPLRSASETIGGNLSRGTIIVFESTVYPGATEEFCVPIIERVSGMKCGVDFKVGYSPERINPGDKNNTLEKIVKVVSGQDDETLEVVAQVYGQIIEAGIHRAPSIKVAEAAKVIENTQRDLNIALMNELSLIFNRLGIHTPDVLAAAGTKWNFLKFTPGLVGGHCIGVDPYYLTYKAQAIGYHPQVILAGRRINDGMGKYVAEMTVKKLVQQGAVIKGKRIAVLGLTFKENVPDIRNSKVVDVIRELQDFGIEVLIHDPLASPEETRREYGLELIELEQIRDASAVILAVPHNTYLEWKTVDFLKLTTSDNGSPLFIDIKACMSRIELEAQGFAYWSL